MLTLSSWIDKVCKHDHRWNDLQGNTEAPAHTYTAPAELLILTAAWPRHCTSDGIHVNEDTRGRKITYG